MTMRLWLPCLVWPVLLCQGGASRPSSSPILDEDVASVRFEDERGDFVVLYYPLSLDNDQCQRRLFGTGGGYLGMFHTLYERDRRVEAYQAAIRDLSMQPGLRQAPQEAEEALSLAGVGADAVGIVSELLRAAGEAMNTRYVAGGVISADVHNALANIGRNLRAQQASPALAAVALVLEEASGSLALGETIAGAVLLHALATDAAAHRLEAIARAIRAEPAKNVDPALLVALRGAEVDVLAATSGIGAFAVAATRDAGKLLSSAGTLSAALAQLAMHANLSLGASLWIAGPVWTYSALLGISDQWEMAQNAACLATVTRLLAGHPERLGAGAGAIVGYGQWAFYGQMQQAFSTTGAKWSDAVNSVLFSENWNRQWADYYARRKAAAAPLLAEAVRARVEPRAAVRRDPGRSGAELFRDDFDRGLGGWVLWGSPRPRLVASARGRSGLFDNNGDANGDSGATSRDSFDLSGGFELEAEVFVAFDDPRGCWNAASIGIGGGGDDAARGQPRAGAWVMLHAAGDACWGTAASKRRHSYLDGGYAGADGPVSFTELPADRFANGWHRLKVAADARRMPTFLVDDEVIYEGQVPLGDFIASPRPIVIGARSSGSSGKSFHDRVVLRSGGSRRLP